MLSYVFPKSLLTFKDAYTRNESDFDKVKKDFENRLQEHVEASRRIKEQSQEINRSKYVRAKASIRPESSGRTSKLNHYLSFINVKSISNYRLNVYDLLYPKKKPLPEIDDKMALVIKEASYPYPPDEVLVEFNGIPISRTDMQTLIGLRWLNDEIINFYLNLIVERSNRPDRKRTYTFNTFFYSKLRDNGYSSIKRWTRRVDIFDYTYLLVPVHLGNHWCLAFINFSNKTLSYYDSLGFSTNRCCDTLINYLKEESMDKRKTEFDTENWRSINAFTEDKIPTQHNSSDCGVFACTYAEYLTREAKLDFTQDQMDYFRRKMIYEIRTKKLIDF